MGFMNVSGSVLDAAARALQTIPGAKTAIGVHDFCIGDKTFIEQLIEVRNLKRFLVYEKIKVTAADIDLGQLNNLQYHRYGRSPNADEWTLLDAKMSALTEYLDPELRRKNKIWELARYFDGMPLAFVLFAITAMATAFFFPRPFTNFDHTLGFWEKAPLFIAVILWTIALGGLGVSAFLNTRLLTNATENMTSKGNDNDVTNEFDVTDIPSIKARLAVGILFAFLLGLPFASSSIRFVLNTLTQPITWTASMGTESASVTANTSASSNSSSTANTSASSNISTPANTSAVSNNGTANTSLITDLAMMIAPFLMGFSTSLVLLILDRFLSAIKILFGIGTTK